MSSSQPARGGVWAQFFVVEPGQAVEAPPGGRVDRYRVEAVHPRVGAPAGGVEAGMTVVRVEAPGPQPPSGRRFSAAGVVQHVVYTDAESGASWRRSPRASGARAPC